MDGFPYNMQMNMDFIKAMQGEFPGDESAEGRLPDHYGCDYIFQKQFFTLEMEEDFYEIAAEFLVKELSNMPKYSKLDYYYARRDLLSTDRIYSAYVLSFMVNAYRSGSENAKNTLFQLYKRYYKKEYNQLKRFSTLSLRELTGLVERDINFAPEAARILFFAELMGIKTDQEINVIYLFLNNVSGRLEDYYEEQSSKNAEWKLKLYEGREEVKAELDKLFPDRTEQLKLQEKWIKATDSALRFFDQESDFLDYSNDMALEYDETLEIAYLLIRKAFPKKEITKDEVILFAEMMNAIGAAGSNKENLEYILGEFPYLLEGVEEKAESMKAPEPAKKNPVSAPAEDLEKEELLSMIQELRIKNHEKEALLKQYKSDLAGYKETQRELGERQEELKDAKSELANLRNYIHELTQEDLPESKVSLEEMKKVLRTKRIVIVGGHANWSGKIKNLFPDWVLIKPSPSGAVETTPVENADFVYFFTDIISHSTYARYINVLRTKKIPFGYLHGVNVEENIRYIYEHLIEEF